MKFYNVTCITFCLIILIISLFTFYDVEPSLGNATLFGVFMYSIFGICTIMFLLTIMIGIWKNKLLDIYTILNVIVTVITGFSPFWIV
jgi:hypothetical protein